MVEGLYEKYPTVEALAEADVDEIEKLCVRAVLAEARRAISAAV